MYDYLIVGAGLYGCVFANQASRRGKKCLVIDKRAHVGGNVYTENVDGIDVHVYGAHIFHTNDEKIWQYVKTFCKFNNFVNSPMARFKGEIYNLPFNMNTFVRMWDDVFTPLDAQKKIQEQRAELAGKTPANLEEQAISLVGRDVYEKLVKGYTEKQWGRDCKDLPGFIIKRLPLRFTFENNYFDADFQGIPIGGYTQIAEKMLAGSEVRLNCEFSSLGDWRKIAKKLVYSGAIDEYYDYCFGALQYRSVRFETETLPIENFQGNAVINYTEREVPFTRIIEHKHFTKAISPVTVITREYPAEWKEKCGMEPYYPINDERNDALYEKYCALAEKEQDVLFGGRLGKYKYYDMDKVIALALSDAENQLKG